MYEINNFSHFELLFYLSTEHVKQKMKKKRKKREHLKIFVRRGNNKMCIAKIRSEKSEIPKTCRVIHCERFQNFLWFSLSLSLSFSRKKYKGDLKSERREVE